MMMYSVFLRKIKTIMNENKDIIIFCDFDGTITVKDVGAEFFNGLIINHNDHSKILDDWFNGRISSLTCLTKECEMVWATKKDADRIIDRQEVDKSFLSFYNEIRENNIDLIILSDGFDYYIQRVLKNYGIDDIPFYANKLIFYDNSRVKPEFPYYDPSCSLFANCKGLMIKKLNNDNKTTVYIGDGYSDICVVPYADVIFAKDDFYDYCTKKDNLNLNGRCHQYNNFDYILDVLKEKYPHCFT